MKLVIKRDQADKTGIFGGSKGVEFMIIFKVELTIQEVDLLEKYKIDNSILTKLNVKGIQQIVTIRGLINGFDLKTKSVTELIEHEESIFKACESFKNYITLLKSFGGEDVYEFKEDGIYDESGEKIQEY